MTQLFVHAPGVPTQTVQELSTALASQIGTALHTSGNFGEGKRQPAVWIQWPEFVTHIDISEYWAVICIKLSSPLAQNLAGMLVGKLIDEAIKWAKKRKPANKPMKVLLYGYDGRLLKDEDWK